MSSTHILNIDDRHDAHHDDNNQITFPKDRIVNIAESDWCVIFSQDSPKKRDTCNINESYKPFSKTLRQVPRKYDKDKCIPNALLTENLFAALDARDTIQKYESLV